MKTFKITKILIALFLFASCGDGITKEGVSSAFSDAQKCHEECREKSIQYETELYRCLELSDFDESDCRGEDGTLDYECIVEGIKASKTKEQSCWDEYHSKMESIKTCMDECDNQFKATLEL
ncbi:hypothetical protein [Mangrovimonas aestuarii]|uniref:hypothetical protein n=1 Tax=Mangrovimonas aestuarii TaxID=3018443 RepID=UPI0023798AC5|nr:hypothetical protein [Mangrovimonas aestuarii]